MAGPRAGGQQVSDEGEELMLRSGEMLSWMHECRDFAPAVLVG
jgi:hypothetical protein